MNHNAHIPVVLAAGAAVRRAKLWSRWPDLAIRSYSREEFAADVSPTSEMAIVLYQLDRGFAKTLRFLDEMARAQSDRCVILLGPDIPADRVAQLLRHGAFDYLTWPCGSARVRESVLSGLSNRRTFLEVRNLSHELARVNQALGDERDMLTRWNRNLSLLNQLTQALAGSLDAEAIATTLFASLRQLLDADVLGLMRTNPEQLWTWAHPSHASREARVRTDLANRLGVARVAPTAQPRLQLLRALHTAGSLPSRDARENRGAPSVTSWQVPLTIGPHAGLLHVERDSGRPFTSQEHQLLATVGASVALSLRNADAYNQLHHLALRDPLTGVLNRRALDGPLTRESKASLRYGTPACLMLLDLDYFKTVNDKLGHMAGDEVLRRVAGLVQETVRGIDSVGRYGGEEFAVILPHTGLEQAHTLAERVRASLERRVFDLADSQVRLTASIGLASLGTSDIRTVPAWIAAADAALYEAKSRGRNCVVTHTSGACAPAEAEAISVAA